VPKSPCDCAQTCSRFQSPLSPPLSVLDRLVPEYSRMTFEEFDGSWSVTFKASQTASYESLVTPAEMMLCRAFLRLSPDLPTAAA
jgi:hypothetical protein